MIFDRSFFSIRLGYVYLIRIEEEWKLDWVTYFVEILIRLG